MTTSLTTPLDVWQHKLIYLQEQEAITSDSAQKFTLAGQIAEAKTKIAELSTFAPTQFALPTIDISHIDKYAPAQLIGREAELRLLDDAWEQAVCGESNRPRILSFVALGGEGKTSLVAHWLTTLAARNWQGCEAVFAWSFYSQGMQEQTAASADLFINEALRFFGDVTTADSATGPYEKGLRLARLVSKRRILLVLDGLEPLQYPLTAATAGELKDQGLSALLRGLAANNSGLCVLTTRHSIPDLKAYWHTTAPQQMLSRLSKEAGVGLLKTLGVQGIVQEFEQLVEDVRGHALTLNLMGSYLRDAHEGDIRRRDRVNLADADTEEQSGHAFRVMEAYETALIGEGERGQRALALLRLLGLFDRPATGNCLTSLLRGDPIPFLTEPLFTAEKKSSGRRATYRPIDEVQLNLVLARLEFANLITVNRGSSTYPTSLSLPASIDAHPLLREYFARQLREQQPEAWKAGHRRIYKHLCESTHEGKKPSLESLQLLCQAVAHGCHAGLQLEVCQKVYYARILRGEEFYSTHKLGAFGSVLGAIVSFFEAPWYRVSNALTQAWQAWLLNDAAFCLRALGRLTEAIEPMRAGLSLGVKQKNWREAAKRAGNLSQLELTLGQVAEAVADAEQSVPYADRSGDAVLRMGFRTTHADALHQAGRRADALARFREAEARQAERQPSYPLLSSMPSFWYCDLLLAEVERVAGGRDEVGGMRDEGVAVCRAVTERANTALKIVLDGSRNLLDIALNYLILGRAGLYGVLKGASAMGLSEEAHGRLSAVASELEAAVAGLRRAGSMDHLPRGLLTRAWLRSLIGAALGPDSAQADLDEAWEIAERGPMRLHLADIHLYRARLFHAARPYPWVSPQHDLAEAERLIHECGYHRRAGELADAKRAILGIG